MGLKKTRNRVQVGPIQRPSYSYYGADKASAAGQGRRNSPLNYKTAIWRRLRFLPTLIAAVVICLAIVFSTTLTNSTKVRFTGGDSPYHSIDDYQTAVSAYMSGSLLNSSKMSINTSKLEANVLSTFPELDAARLALPIIGRKPLLTLHVRKPALVLTTKTSALVLDNTGRAVSDTKLVPSSAVASLLTLQDESGLEVHIGDQAVTSETVSFIGNVKLQLDDKKLIVDHLVLPAFANEVDIYIKGLTYHIKTDASGDARLQIGAFIATKDSGVNPGEYMDVRVEEKVFYR